MTIQRKQFSLPVISSFWKENWLHEGLLPPYTNCNLSPNMESPCTLSLMYILQYHISSFHHLNLLLSFFLHSNGKAFPFPPSSLHSNNFSPSSTSSTSRTHQHHPGARKSRAIHNLHETPQSHTNSWQTQLTAQQLKPRHNSVCTHRQRILKPKSRNTKLHKLARPDAAGAVPHPPHSLLHLTVPNRK